MYPDEWTGEEAKPPPSFWGARRKSQKIWPDLPPSAQELKARIAKLRQPSPKQYTRVPDDVWEEHEAWKQRRGLQRRPILSSSTELQRIFRFIDPKNISGVRTNEDSAVEVGNDPDPLGEWIETKAKKRRAEERKQVPDDYDEAIDWALDRYDRRWQVWNRGQTVRDKLFNEFYSGDPRPETFDPKTGKQDPTDKSIWVGTDHEIDLRTSEYGRGSPRLFLIIPEISAAKKKRGRPRGSYSRDDKAAIEEIHRLVTRGMSLPEAVTKAEPLADQTGAENIEDRKARLTRKWHESNSGKKGRN